MARLDVAEVDARGFDDDRFGGEEIGVEFAGDFGGADVDGVGPVKMIFGRDDQLAGVKRAFDLRAGVDGECAFGPDLTDESSLDGSFAGENLGVEDVALWFNDEDTFGAEVFRNCVGDVVIAQIDVRAALFAHRRFCGDRDFEFGAAIEAGDAFLFRAGFFFLRLRMQRLLDIKMPAAFLAHRGDSGGRNSLRVPAVRARHWHFILLTRRHNGSLTLRERKGCKSATRGVSSARFI